MEITRAEFERMKAMHDRAFPQARSAEGLAEEDARHRRWQRQKVEAVKSGRAAEIAQTLRDGKLPHIKSE